MKQQETFTPGQDVVYNGKPTHVKIDHGDGDVTIKNPDWNWDDEALDVELGEDYGESFWITVSANEIKSANE